MLRPTFALIAGIAVLAVGRPCLAQDAGAKITFKHEPATVAVLLADLAKATGTPFQANASVAGDVVMIDVKDVTLDDTMRQLAAVLHAEWNKSGSTYTLTRSTGLINADRKAELGEKAAALARGIAKKLGIVKSQGKFDDDAARKLAKSNQDMMDRMLQGAMSGGGGVMRINTSNAEDMGAKTPAGRAIISILSQLSSSQLSALVTGNRVVFSNHPTKMQYPLPAAAVAALEGFVREQRIYAEAQKDLRSKAEDGTRIVIGGLGDSEAGEGNPSLGLGAALLVVDPGLTRNPNVQLLVADRNGGTLARGSMSLPMETAETTPTPFAFPGEQPIKLSDLATEFAKALGSANGSGGARMMRVAIAAGSAEPFEVSGDPLSRPPVKTSKELRERILNPEKYEPLALAPGEGFAAVAESWGKNFVAYLPDDVLLPISSLLVGAKTTPSQLLANVQTTLDLAVATDGDWLTVTPRRHATARTKKVERAALGKTLRTLDAQGYLKLDDLATFALAQSKQLNFGDFDAAYMRLINYGFADQVFSRFAFNGGWGMLRFYGTLSPAQRHALGSNQQIPLANLTTQQIDLIADQVFNSFDGPAVVNPGSAQDERRQIMRFAGLSLEYERTIALPNGITRQGFLSLAMSSTPAVQGVETQSGATSLMTPSSIAWSRLQQERPELLGGIGTVPNLPDKFRTASQTSYRFRFDLAPNVSLSRSLQDVSLDRNGALVNYETLPAEFRGQVDRMLEELRSSMGKVRTSGGPVRPPSR